MVDAFQELASNGLRRAIVNVALIRSVCADADAALPSAATTLHEGQNRPSVSFAHFTQLDLNTPLSPLTMAVRKLVPETAPVVDDAPASTSVDHKRSLAHKLLIELLS